MYLRIAKYCSTVAIVAVPRYPTNTPPTPTNYAHLLQSLVVLRYSCTQPGDEGDMFIDPHTMIAERYTVGSLIIIAPQIL